jgi:transcriptional regulator with XRE-family HTH domain
MNERRTRREELDLAQTEAAARAGVSLATWRRWEDNPANVGADTRTRCQGVLDADQAFKAALAQQATKFQDAWKECPSLTPRQAYAIAGVLDFWGDHDIGLWLDGTLPGPMHEVAPFDSLDRRVMIWVNDNKAWAGKARERCYAVSDEIERGVLPFDRDGCFFDELLMACALREAQERLEDMPDLFDRVPPRLRAAEDEDDLWVLDDDWDLVSDHFDDNCRWDEWEVPVMNNHPLLAAVLRDRHPYTWFDPTEPSGSGYLQRLTGLVVDDEPQED